MELEEVALARFCRETHAFVPMRVKCPIKPGQNGGRRRLWPSHLETILSPRPQARLERAGWSPAKQGGGSFRRERKIEAILLSGFSFARRSLHQQFRDLHEVVGKHGCGDPHLKTFGAFGKAALHATPAEQHRDTPLDARSEALAVLELRALLIGFSLGRFCAAALVDAHHLDAILFARRHVVLTEEPAIASIQVGSAAEGLLVAF